MSLQTWCDEFYPESASAPKTNERAIGHSLRKWTGLRIEELRKHGILPHERSGKIIGVSESGGKIFGIDVFTVFPVDSTTCALCCLHINNGCIGCPLYEARNCHPCDMPMIDEERAPFREFTDNGNPGPMIEWLLKAEKLNMENEIAYRQRVAR